MANPVGRPQHCLGSASRRAAGGAGDDRYVVPAVGVAARRACAPTRRGRTRPTHGSRPRRRRRRCRPCARRWTPTPPRGGCRYTLDAEDTRALLGEVPAAFHAGIHDILLIGFALAMGGVPGCRRHADRHRRRRPRSPRGTGRRRRPVAHRRMVHHQVPGGAVGRRTVVGAGRRGRRGVGRGRQGRQRAASRAAARRLTYGLLRYLNADVDLDGCRPGDRIQLSWAPGSTGDARAPTICGGSARTVCPWPTPPRQCRCRCRTPWSSTPAPSTPRRARSCRPTGPGRPRRSTTPRSPG